MNTVLMDQAPPHILTFFLMSLSPQVDKNIPNSTKVAVEVTPPMNGVAGGDEVRLQSFFHLHVNYKEKHVKICNVAIIENVFILIKINTCGWCNVLNPSSDGR